MSKPFLMGAVAYAPKVVTIWEGFKEYFYQSNFNFDYILYSNYERQVEAQFEGSIDIAWNSPLAWLRADRIARSKGLSAPAVVMRDTDQDLTSVLVSRSCAFSDLREKTVGFGAIDSPQSTLIPIEHMRQNGLIAEKDFKVRRFDVLGGKHGDHIGGERAAAVALMNKEVDAAWMIDGNYFAFSREGILPSGTTQIIARTEKYDHCNFTVSPSANEKQIKRFSELLLTMKWEDSNVRHLMELEGLKAWLPGRTSGYDLIINAIDNQNFYDSKGNILVSDYRY